MKLIFGREPALWAMLIAAVVQGCGLMFHWSDPQVGTINGLTTLVLGAIVAFMTHDGFGAALLGALQGVLNLVLAFGLNVDTATQAAIMTLAAAVVAMFTRSQVTAKVAADGSRANLRLAA